MDGDELKAKNRARESQNKISDISKQDELNELFGRNFEAQPKQFTYKGSPVDKGNFFNYFTSSGYDDDIGYVGYKKLDDNNLLYKHQNWANKNNPILFRFTNDGNLRAYRSPNDYQDFGSLEELYGSWGYPQIESDFYNPNNKYDFYSGAYTNDEDDEFSRGMDNEYANWKLGK